MRWRTPSVTCCVHTSKSAEAARTWPEAPMAIQLNHTIVHARDPQASAQFLAEILGLGAPKPFGPFIDVEVDNGVTLAFIRAEPDEIIVEHYAFLVSEAE